MTKKRKTDHRLAVRRNDYEKMVGTSKEKYSGFKCPGSNKK